MPRGRIIKAYGGFYYVKDEERLWECRLRGKYRFAKENFWVGDEVEFQVTGAQSGVIEARLPRQSEIRRPPVANVDQAVLVMAVVHPKPDLLLLDRLLIQSARAGLAPVILFNKVDLDPEAAQPLVQIYGPTQYPVLITSAKARMGVDKLAGIIQGRVSVLAGPSGVGKSSLINALKPGLKLKSAAISTKAERGRHTTRHAELLEVAGGLVCDTPGFSKLDLPEIAPQGLASYFPEMEGFLYKCKFNSCLHHREPGCAIKAAVEAGSIAASRYHNYVKFLEELIERERRY